MQTTIYQGVTTNPSTAQVLEPWSSGYRPDFRSLYMSFQRWGRYKGSQIANRAYLLEVSFAVVLGVSPAARAASLTRGAGYIPRSKVTAAQTQRAIRIGRARGCSRGLM